MRYTLIVCLLFFSTFSWLAKAKTLAVEHTNCTINKNECTQCPYTTPSHSSTTNTSGIIVLSVIIGLASYYFFKLYKRRYIIVIGGIIVASLITSSGFVRPSVKNQESGITTYEISTSDEFHETGDEFISVNQLPDSEITNEVSDEFSSVGTSDEFANSDDFINVDDEFAASGADDITESSEVYTINNSKQEKKNNKHLVELGILFIVLIVIALFIKNSTFRKLRPLFLLAMVVWLGFIRGGCPCMISSFHNAILAGLGNDMSWISMLWFLGLIPITYFLGKIWCGWLCHLGGLQEFLFAATKLEFLKEAKHQKIIKGIQISIFIILLIQITVTQTNIFTHYDPFKVAFNLFSAHTTGYILLFVLLVSSVLIYRPFCRAFCPVGMVLGLVSMLPKARKIGKSQDCVDCIRCSKECKSGAMIYENKTSQINISNCIVCGDCIDSCRKNALIFHRNKR